MNLDALPDTHKALVQGALDRCDFPFDKLRTPYAGDIVFRMEDLSDGAAWHSQGYVGIDTTGKVNQYRILHELAHAVDDLFLTDEHRRLIRGLLTGGRGCDHAWLHEQPVTPYDSQVGEAWPDLFVTAYSTVEVPKRGNVHQNQATADNARLLRYLLTPELSAAPHLEAPHNYKLVATYLNKTGNQVEAPICPLTAHQSILVRKHREAGRKVLVRG